jgi:hypothetical protein
MRISELLGADVHDANGRLLGRVHDVRLVQDEMVKEGGDARLRVDALLVGKSGVASRLGYVRNGVRGPWLLKLIATARERRADEISWSELAMTGGRLVRHTGGDDRVTK